MPEGFSKKQDDLGSAPEITDSLEVTNRTINSVDQAFSVCDTLINDWKSGTSRAARITAKLNGERPYSQHKLEKGGKGWKSNISTGFLSTECSKVLPRFFMPIKTAKYLTAATLPPGWADGAEKTAFFRQVITDTFRSWSKMNFFIRGLARETGIWGFSFAWFPDEYEWRPSLIRMDKGFVPQGTEIMEEPQFFLVKYDYRPSELFNLLKENVDAGRDEWQKDNVVKAINEAFPPSVDSSQSEARSYEELIRQSTYGYSYTKGVKVIRTYHLFAKEATGFVSHYVLWNDNTPGTNKGTDVDNKLLYEKLDKFGSMNEVVQTFVFDYGDGTVHGSWGAGQILFDLAVQVEKVRNDSIDNIRLTNKAKVEVPESKNVNDVKQLVNDQFVIISGAKFSGNTAGMTSDVEGYNELDMKLTQLAQQKIGAFVPPIPLQPNDIKAAQINAAMISEKELQEALLENWLIQFAEMMRTVTKRLTNPNSPDKVAQATLIRLMEKLTAEEVEMLANQFPVKSVMDFTEFKAQQRGTFASSVVNNPLFKQSVVARYMAEGAGDESFVSSIVVPDGDQTDSLAAQRQQTLENTALQGGNPVPVLPSDNDWIHMQTLKPKLQAGLMNPQPTLPALKAGIQHYASHWQMGVNKKTLPQDQINPEKSWIAQAEKVILGLEEQEQLKQQALAAEAQATAQAQQLIQSGQA